MPNLRLVHKQALVVPPPSLLLELSWVLQG